MKLGPLMELLVTVYHFRLQQPWLVQAGLSLNQSSVQDIKMNGRHRSGAGVRCVISISNWSMFTLLDVEVNNECGRTNSQFPPKNVFPGYRSVATLHVGIFQVAIPWLALKLTDG